MTIEDRTRQQYAKVFVDWRIEGEMIGHGSQGKTAVFKITKENSGFTETGALKIINIYEVTVADNNDQIEEIEKEITSVKKNAETELAAMNRMKGHGNIVSYHEFAFEEYKSESVRGVDLLIRMDFFENIGEKIKEGVIFPESEILRMGIDLSRALADCHNKGILHRDIKPDNIFMNEFGYLLGDFGIAKYSEENNLVASTVAGSYPYAAPEQIKLIGTCCKDGLYDYRVDIYALGLSLYELANKDRIPFATSTYKRAEDIQKRLNGNTLPGLPSINKGLEAVILRACAYKPEDRFQTAEDLYQAFEKLSLKAKSQKSGESQKNDEIPVSEETFTAMGGALNRNESEEHFENMLFQPRIEKAKLQYSGEKKTKKKYIIILAFATIVVMLAIVFISLHKEKRLSDDWDTVLENFDSQIDGSEDCEEGYEYLENRDYDNALACFKKGVEKGNSKSQIYLGFMYYYGLGVEQDFDEAHKWIRPLAEQGDPSAQQIIGCSYYYGYGVEKNYNTAFKWVQLSADQGNYVAQFMLGYMFYCGEGVEQDSEKAREWISKSAEQGYPDAVDAMEEWFPDS